MYNKENIRNLCLFSIIMKDKQFIVKKEEKYCS